MKQKLLFGLLFTLLVAGYQTFTASGQTDISVSNADAILKPNLTSSTTLNSAISTVSNRVASEFSDALRVTTLSAPDSTLQTVLDQVAKRVSFDFAQASRVTTLQFPKTLVNDTTPPQVKGAISTQLGSNSATLLVSTSEFTIATVDYGTQPGSYSKSQSTKTFARQHSLALSGVAANSVVFYKLTLTDLSGNLATTPEASFTATEKRSVYLPLISR